VNRRILALVAASCLAAVFATAAEARSTQPPAQSGVQPEPYRHAATPDPDAQTPPASQTSGQSPATNGRPPAKKVWTNDEISDLRDRSTISTSPDASKAKTAKPAGKPAAAAKDRNENRYRDQIAKLQAQIPPLEEKIARLRAALQGHAVNETRQYGWVKPGNWQDEKAQLEKKRDAIQDRISALEDEARQKGDPANLLP
jgi:hypothetical protein